jgi:hypothetical protein
VTSAVVNALSVSNGFVKFPAGFSLTVTQDVTVTVSGGLDLSNSVVNIGHDLVINSDYRAGAYFRGGPSQSVSIGSNLSLMKGWIDLSGQGLPSVTVPVGKNVTLTNGAIAYLRSGATNGTSAYGLLVDVHGEILIASNSWVYPYSHTTNGGSVHFQAANLKVLAGGGVNADTAGFSGGPGNPSTDGKAFGPGAGGGRPALGTRGPGGGGYGGEGKAGGQYGYAAGGPTYGSSNAPADPGSGGGGSFHPGTAGGGLIHVAASDGVLMDGSMLASGGSVPNEYGACGSGGGIYVNCRTFAGSGLLKANGGSSGRNAPDYGGSGGGGRIAVAYKTSTNGWSGTTLVDGGVGSYTGNVGTNGTVVFWQIPPPGSVIIVR